MGAPSSALCNARRRSHDRHSVPICYSNATFPHDKRRNQKPQKRFSHSSVTFGCCHKHTTSNARQIIIIGGDSPYPLIPSATLECVTRCLTLSTTTLVEKLPPQDGTFPDERNGLLGTLHLYRMCVRCYTIYIIIYTGTYHRPIEI